MALAKEWDELVERVRELEGFEDFLRRPSLDALVKGADKGPVVLVNVSRWRCDALIVTATGGAKPVELPKLTADDVHRRTVAYLDALDDSKPVAPAPNFAAALEARRKARDEREAVLRSTVEWLWEVVAEPVFDELGYGPSDAPTQRLWWCPTGLLTLLPLHGAGYHDARDGRTVLDRVIPSYTPTLRVLSERAGTPATDSGPSPLLFVGVPDVPDQLSLTDDVARERTFLGDRFPWGVDVVENSAATVAAVRAAMANHRYVHLSCHGLQNLNDPSEAGFVLSDGMLTVLLLSAARFAGEFAFLAACRTAAGGVKLPDEVITLAAALNYTGYRHVVGTLWSVDSAVAAEVTEAVYADLIDDGVFHPERSASALHQAVRSMRDGLSPLDDWLPFIHIGS